uniref:Red chlorophyll catabolite reductase n=1 Tax=Picrorhiza kurrooa TaxID=195120 RepID=A0A024CJG0_9LAMI|nr:red chlorophyll catabolite reductase [Picrorhiza kurrooa]
MSVISPRFSYHPPPISSRSNRRPRISCSSAPMDSSEKLRAKFMEFPYASAQQKALMVKLVSSVETRLGPSLQPCILPPDVQHFGNPNGTAHASIHLKSGIPSSQIDLILGSWIHCKLPSGGALNITSLSAYLKSSTDAPHFLIDLIQSSPTSLVLILDLTPRKDLILYPNYLKTYYEDTRMDKHRQYIQSLPEVRPYYSPSLYVRALISPTAILVNIDSGNSEAKTMEEIIRDHVGPVAEEMLQFWLDECACLEKCVEGDERAYLEKRDEIVKSTTIEVDLGSSFPRLFGEEVAGRVLSVLKEYYNA